MIKCTNLSVKNGRVALLTNISLEIPAGRITCLLGSSGAGKTTLLRTIAQLNENYDGSIIIDGKEDSSLSPQQLSEQIGFVFQQFNLFGFLTVLENCTLSLRVVKKLNIKDAQERAYPLLEKFGISQLSDRYPAHISGGQQQRAAIARALCLNPKSLLLDEPTSALDPSNASGLAALLKDLAYQGIAIAVASQDTAFIRMIMDRAYVLESGSVLATYDSHIDTQMPQAIKLFYE